MFAENKKISGSIKVCCPVCDRTVGFVEIPGNGFFSIKCQRCGKIIRINMNNASAVKARHNLRMTVSA